MDELANAKINTTECNIMTFKINTYKKTDKYINYAAYIVLILNAILIGILSSLLQFSQDTKFKVCVVIYILSTIVVWTTLLVM